MLYTTKYKGKSNITKCIPMVGDWFVKAKLKFIEVNILRTLKIKNDHKMKYKLNTTDI